MQNHDAIKKELWIHRILSVLLIVVVAVCGLRLLLLTREDVEEKTRVQTLSRELPFGEKVFAIMGPLEYSGLPDLIRPEVTLNIDFGKRAWTLHNLHRFETDGEILLDHGRYGLCGELAAHVYKEIRPLFGDQYDIRFVRAAESGFFLRPQSSHIVLLLMNKSTGDRYFLDPSFHRYGKEADFEDYLFFEVADAATHFNSLKPDVSFAADSGTPLLIRKKFLLYFTVESVEEKFDQDNFVLAVTANKRYQYSGRYVLALRVQNGQPQTFRNEWLLKQFLTPQESQELLAKLKSWFGQYQKGLGESREVKQTGGLAITPDSREGRILAAK